MDRHIDLPPTCVYAFGVAVPKCAYRPFEAIAALFLSFLLAAAAILILSPIIALTGTVVGTVYLILKYCFRRTPSRLKPRE